MIIILEVLFHPNTMGQDLWKGFIDPNTNHSSGLPSYRKPKEALNEMLKLMSVLSPR